MYINRKIFVICGKVDLHLKTSNGELFILKKFVIKNCKL